MASVVVIEFLEFPSGVEISISGGFSQVLMSDDYLTEAARALEVHLASYFDKGYELVSQSSRSRTFESDYTELTTYKLIQMPRKVE